MGHCHGHPAARSPGLAPQTDAWHLLWHAVLTGTWTEVLGHPSVGDRDSAVQGNHRRAGKREVGVEIRSEPSVRVQLPARVPLSPVPVVPGVHGDVARTRSRSRSVTSHHRHPAQGAKDRANPDPQGHIRTGAFLSHSQVTCLHLSMTFRPQSPRARLFPSRDPRRCVRPRPGSRVCTR